MKSNIHRDFHGDTTLKYQPIPSHNIHEPHFEDGVE